MEVIEKPYFMSNKEWFYFDPIEWRYFLTSKAPPKAKKSYDEYYEFVKTK